MAEYIKLDKKKINRLRNETHQFDTDIACAIGTDFMQNIAEAENRMILDILNGLESEATADVVEVKKVAEMLNDLFGDNCPCNYNDIDEWLPYCCEHANTCDCPCEDGWVQFIKHYDKRKEGAEGWK